MVVVCRYEFLVVDEVEFIVLKRVEVEVDVDLIDKDDDEVDDFDYEDVVVGFLFYDNLRCSYSNLVYEVFGLVWSLGGRIDVSEGGGSGSGSLLCFLGLGWVVCW